MKEIIPLFFAINDNFAKYLKVTLQSIKENASQNYIYEVIILNIGLKDETKKLLNKCKSKNFRIIYYDVRNKLQTIAQDLSVKDYYNKATYYRLFVSNLFPQYNKALYLDSDVIVLGDIAEAGDYTESTHLEIVDIINNSTFDVLITCGVELSKAIANSQMREGLRVLTFDNQKSMNKAMSSQDK